MSVAHMFALPEAAAQAQFRSPLHSASHDLEWSLPTLPHLDFLHPTPLLLETLQSALPREVGRGPCWSHEPGSPIGDGIENRLHLRSRPCRGQMLQIERMSETGNAVAKSEVARKGPERAVLANYFLYSGAAERTRTSGPIITNDVLYHLSYSGDEALLSPY